ncbi:MAG: hypothetical protein RLZZ367_923 [Bacteroidota bacterium]|jgi:ribosomal protein L37E
MIGGNYFKARKLVIGTMHGKEKAIAPVLEQKLGVTCVVVQGLDTDQLGTFTGEIERPYDPLTTARRKCSLAMQIAGCDLGVASEASFGPHPYIPFISVGDEWLFFIDKKNDLEVYSREFSTATNFGGMAVNDEKELMDFATRAGFPTHRLILRSAGGATTGIVKGISNTRALLAAFDSVKNKYGSVFAETDMRAMHNPTRMLQIEKAANALAAKLQCHCPVCNTPGFGIYNAKTGLPCGQCGLPTQAILSYVHRCVKCGYEQDEMYPAQKHYADPAGCDCCNP